jgi:twitching motility protein PilJ
VLSTVKDYIRDRQAAQTALQASEQNLLALNDNLQIEAEIRKQQEEQIRRESEQLQQDIGELLDVVCTIEEGDLTVQAKVNERETGLIADTLNRSIESLNRIMLVVVANTKQVTESASELATVAVETATQAQYQTASVREVESLMNSVNALTADSRSSAIAADDAVQLAKFAVQMGKEEMTAMVDGIAILQDGTDRVVRRAQLLNDFVDLAAQFSKDQKRVASLTRVLALNASTLSSRALKEQDPDRFAAIAKEFEAIATQVNNLSTETNGGLLILQQRTEGIQTVTSGLNEDVTEIGNLVQKFTTEVAKSRQAFDNIETVTEQVAQIGQKVSQSSEEIVAVVQKTLDAVRAIATVAQTTEAKANITRERVNSMGELARNLLEMVEFFQLHDISQIYPAPVTPSTPEAPKEDIDSTVAREPYEMILTAAE